MDRKYGPMVCWRWKNTLIFNYSTKVDTKATVDVYEQEIADFDGTTIPADDLLAKLQTSGPNYGRAK